MKRYSLLIFALVLFLFGLALRAASAAPRALPAGFTREMVVTGLDQPTAFAFDGGTIYVASKNGSIRVVLPDGSLRAQPYATLSVSNQYERGLLGLALHPDYANQPYVYVYYTTGPGALNYSGAPTNRVSRLLTVNGVGVQEQILLDNIPASGSGIHNGGDIQFGPDGRLYIAVGDSDNMKSAQRLSSLAGKILRINANGRVPRRNPFFKTKKARPEIYAYGFRNPFRISFLRSRNALFAGDVGWGKWEELDSIQRGRNYGWPLFEGPCPLNVYCDPSKTDFGATTPPIWYYSHTTDPYNAILVGAFAEGSNYPAPFNGALFLGDLFGWVRVLSVDAQNTVTAVTDFDTLSSPVCFRLGPDRNIYVASLAEGAIYRYKYTP